MPAKSMTVVHIALLVFAAAACGRSGPTDGAEIVRTVPSVSSSTTGPAREQVRFQYRGTTVSGQPTQAPRCPAQIVHATVRGTATLLGTMTGEVSHCVGDGSLDFRDGRFTFLGENGDRLRGTHFGTFVPTTDSQIFTFTGQITFTGGTGKLAGATGNADLSGRIDMRTGVATVAIDGAVSFSPPPHDMKEE